MAREQLGKRIKRGRKGRGLTQVALAERVGVSLIYVKKLEAGERQAPSLPVLERIAKALKVKLVDLLK